MALVTSIPIVIYALTKTGRDFDLARFFAAGKTRLTLGFILVVLLSLVIVYVPDAKGVLTALGFNAEVPSGLGLALGAMLVAVIRGDENSEVK
jgi:membrane protease YdiL (CAAX protease family)